MRNTFFATLLAITFAGTAHAELDSEQIRQARQTCLDFGYQTTHENYADCVREEYRQLRLHEREDPYDRNSADWLTRDDSVPARQHEADLLAEARWLCQDFAYSRYPQAFARCVRNEFHYLRINAGEDPYDRNSDAWLTHGQTRQEYLPELDSLCPVLPESEFYHQAPLR